MTDDDGRATRDRLHRGDGQAHPGHDDRFRHHRPPIRHELGAMVALFPDAAAACRLARRDGVPEKDLHLSLAVLEPDQVADLAVLRETVLHLAQRWPPLAGSVGGLGRFSGGGNPKGDPVFALVDGDHLAELRRDLVLALEMAGFEVTGKETFIPHITLRWIAPSERIPDDDPGAVGMTFDSLHLVVAEDSDEALPLGATRLAPPGTPDGGTMPAPPTIPDNE
jgi:2'-5' RNA ligase